jgi:hypothetical protein
MVTVMAMAGRTRTRRALPDMKSLVHGGDAGRMASHGPMRAILIIVLALLTCGIATAITVPLTLGSKGIFFRALPLGASSRADEAYRLIQRKPGERDLERAAILARGALNREPVNVEAARTLGLIAGLKEDKGADRIMRYAEALSRRDFPTQMWWIESDVRSNDISSALRHYDRALSTSRSARTLLMPILVGAAADPAIYRPLGRILDQRPDWTMDFARALVRDGRSASAVSFLVTRLRLDPSVPEERQVVQGALDRLITLNGYREAESLARTASAKNGFGPVLRNGDFGSERGLAPFDWQLAEDADLAGVVEDRAPGNPALFLYMRNGRAGDAAKQLVLLGPGPHRISVTAGTISGDVAERPKVGVTCAGTNGRKLVELILQPAPDAGRRQESAFQVPRGCAAQWIVIRAQAPLDGDAPRSWIDDVQVH